MRVREISGEECIEEWSRKIKKQCSYLHPKPVAPNLGSMDPLVVHGQLQGVHEI